MEELTRLESFPLCFPILFVAIFSPHSWQSFGMLNWRYWTRPLFFPVWNFHLLGGCVAVEQVGDFAAVVLTVRLPCGSNGGAGRGECRRALAVARARPLYCRTAFGERWDGRPIRKMGAVSEMMGPLGLTNFGLTSLKSAPKSTSITTKTKTQAYIYSSSRVLCILCG